MANHWAVFVCVRSVADSNRRGRCCRPLPNRLANRPCCKKRRIVVEDNGVEPMTFCMPCKRSTS